ncbi:MAG: adenylate/guanylate cyclase domain-containing protein [Labrys sp. (in: a-proteobacteria)]
MKRPLRRLTVIVALDIAGYTAMLRADEIGTLDDVRAIYDDIAKRSLHRYGATIIKTMGDGAIIEFESVLDAVEWTMGFQRMMAARNAEPGRRIINIRAAIVLADVIVTGDDRFGTALAFAARLQEQAPPGGILITHSVRWQLVGETVTHFRRLDPISLRSFDQPMEVFVWAPEGVRLPPAATPVEAPRHAADGLPSIVVLPFDAMSDDPTVLPAADGAVEELTATLSRTREFLVVARNSAYAFRNRPTDVRTLGNELGVSYVIEGSVRKSGQTLRVTVQLIDATTGAHVWSGRIDGTTEDVFALQDAVAQRVVGAVQPAIRAAEIERAKRKSIEEMEARDLILRAMPSFWAHRRDDNLVAMATLEQALALEPTNTLALALLGWCLGQQVTYLWSNDIVRDKARALALADEAARLATNDAVVFTAIGATLSILSVDQTRALAFIDRALMLDPNFAWAWTRAGYAQAYSGRPAEGARSFQRAIELSPEDPIHFNAHAGLGICRFLLGDYRGAVEAARRAINDRPGMIWANRLLATSAAHLGDRATATAAVAALLAEHPGLTVQDVAEGIHNLAGADLARYLDGLRLAGLPDRA